MLEIHRGTKEDIAQVAAIYDHILTEEEEGRAVIGWIRGVYPTENTAKEAVKNDDLFVMTDAGRIVAAARINQVQVSEYADANWKYQDILPEQVMVLHTLVVDPGQSGKGYGSAFVKFYEDYAKELTVRICVWIRMRKTRLREGCMHGLDTGRRILCLACLTAFRACSLCVLRRQYKAEIFCKKDSSSARLSLMRELLCKNETRGVFLWKYRKFWKK